jgi:hypothetical protein
LLPHRRSLLAFVWRGTQSEFVAAFVAGFETGFSAGFASAFDDRFTSSDKIIASAICFMDLRVCRLCCCSVK